MGLSLLSDWWWNSGFRHGIKEMLHCVDWLVTDVSGQPIGPVFKGQVYR